MKIFGNWFQKLYLLLFFLSSALDANHAVVFMYHHFGKDKFPSTNIRLEQFQKHLNYLEEHDYNVWPLSKIIVHIKNKSYIPPKTVSITIDDAYISTYTHAYPMLREKRFPFTVFVNTTPIGKKSINYMTWGHMREMQRYGAEFANHSSTHDYLIPKNNETQIQWKKRIKKEILKAQNVLQKELGNGTNNNPRLLSYPFGEYTKESADYIKALGYIGVSQTSGVLDYSTDLRKIPRYAMSESFADMEGFILKLNTLALPVKSAEPWNPKVKFNPPILYLKLDKHIQGLQCYNASGGKTKIKLLGALDYEIQATLPLEGPRNRYTCTAKGDSEKWYWYSHLWILDDD